MECIVKVRFSVHLVFQIYLVFQGQAREKTFRTLFQASFEKTRNARESV